MTVYEYIEDIPDGEPVAEHEAAHVVVALALGRTVERSSIVERRTVITLPVEPVRLALFCLAGQVYEEILEGRHDGDPPPLPPHSSSTISERDSLAFASRWQSW